MVPRGKPSSVQPSLQGRFVLLGERMPEQKAVFYIDRCGACCAGGVGAAALHLPGYVDTGLFYLAQEEL